MTHNRQLTKSPISLTAARAAALALVAAMLAAAALAFINSAPTRVQKAAAATLAPVNTPVDVCQPDRPAGVWFPHQIESQFVRDCARP